MKRIDHLLFQADTDFIAYHDALSRSSDWNDSVSDFGSFIVQHLKVKKDVRRALSAVEAIMKDGGCNAEQLRRSFFPALNRELREEAERSAVESLFGPLSKTEWERLQTVDRSRVI